MPRFSLRDLFWLTLVVGMGVGWWRATQAARIEVEQARAELREWKNKEERRMFDFEKKSFLKGISEREKMQREFDQKVERWNATRNGPFFLPLPAREMQNPVPET